MANRVVSVALVADVGSYVSGMARASASTKAFGSQTQQVGQQTSRGFDLAGKSAVLLGAGALAVGVGLKSAIGAASDLNETLNKSNVIFGKNAAEVEAWAQGSAKNFGLSKQAALEAASGFGNMLQQLGFAGDEAVTASTGVVKLAADLGSFNNLETGDVLDRIGAAMRGEYDSLQLLIPNINAARVESEAMAETGKDNAKQLTAQEKAAAVLAIVHKDGAAAANDFAETSDGLANSTKIAKAQFEDLKSEIGQEFLPVATRAMGFLSDTAIPVLGEVFHGVMGLVDGFSDLPGPMQVAIAAGLGWAVAGDRIMSAFRPIGGALSPLRDGWRAFGEAMEYARAKGDGLGTVLQSVGSYAGGQALTGLQALGRAIGPELAIAASAFVVTGFIDGIRSISEASDEAKAAAEGLANALTLTDRAADRKSIRTAIEDTEGLVEVLEKAGISSEEAIDGLLGQEAAQRKVLAALEAYKAEVYAPNGAGGSDESQTARDAALAYEELATGYGTAASNARYFADESDAAADSTQDAADKTTAAAQQTVTDAEAAQKALEDWINELAGIADAFVDPLGTYQSMLQTAAQVTADSTSSQTDSWQDFVDTTKVNLDDYAQKLQDQITAQENWATNLGIIAQRAGLDVAQHLAEMGTDGVGLVAQMANGSDAEMQRMAELLRQDAALAGSGAATALDEQMKVMAAVGAGGAQATVQGIAAQLGIGADTVRSIAAKYGAALAEGINPILLAVGRPTVTASGRMGGTPYYDGGYTGPGGKYEPAGIVHRGEYVLTKEQTARLGIDRIEEFANNGYANGGFVTAADVPRPPSTAPYRAPISTAGDAAMDTEYEATANFVRQNGPFGRALAWANSQVGKPYIWGGVGPAGYDCSGFMSAITNVILGRGPHSRVGATANFPWPGFAPGDGQFTIGSTPNTGDGIGHMAGTLLGINVESRGGQGVVVGGSARGARNGLFGTRGHLAMYGGGVIGEPVAGVGLRSGSTYSFGERGPETVLPGIRSREFSGSSGGGAGGGVTTHTREVHITAVASPNERSLAKAIADRQRDLEFLHG